MQIIFPWIWKIKMFLLKSLCSNRDFFGAVNSQNFQGVPPEYSIVR